VAAVKNTNEVSDLLVSYEKIKWGRKIVALDFTIKSKTAAADVEAQIGAGYDLQSTLRNVSFGDDRVDKVQAFRWAVDAQNTGQCERFLALLPEWIEKPKDKEKPIAYFTKTINAELENAIGSKKTQQEVSQKEREDRINFLRQQAATIERANPPPDAGR